MNSGPYILAAYLLTAAGVLVYRLSLNWRRKALSAQIDALRRQLKDAAK